MMRIVRNALLCAALGLVLCAVSSAGEPSVYRVERGDTLWTITLDYYGDGFLWPAIYRASCAGLPKAAGKPKRLQPQQGYRAKGAKRLHGSRPPCYLLFR